MDAWRFRRPCAAGVFEFVLIDCYRYHVVAVRLRSQLIRMAAAMDGSSRWLNRRQFGQLLAPAFLAPNAEYRTHTPFDDPAELRDVGWSIINALPDVEYRANSISNTLNLFFREIPSVWHNRPGIPSKHPLDIFSDTFHGFLHETLQWFLQKMCFSLPQIISKIPQEFL